MPLLGAFPTGTAWGRINDDNLNEIPADPNYKNSLVSLQYRDEPTLTPAFLSAAASMYALVRQVYPNTLSYTNFSDVYRHPSSIPELRNYMQTTNPDMLMFDNYPDFSFAPSSRFNWYSTLQQYRTLGIAGIDGTGDMPIPYGLYLNLFRPTFGSALPSESFVRLQQFSGWAFGYTMASAFVYNNPYPGSSQGDCAMLGNLR